ncbi:E3 ubiquitin ligase BIG BROTHER-related-like [Ananas comosus]|uniref:E3 ubiquitin ligase BIG BROTHER-related-like n=1 Tax=Ananas comosus TaxID=4615 RepID=A0A6P5H5N1_ANACO|nr:E3 ubiquitin ligase BIG BROTHER-related-like [Ananas comosus]XP_020114933.1 E3 ubiquitin ligase BIG BROTHER-related-like [Ananas comosus]
MAIGFETKAKQEMVSQYVNTPTNEWQEHFDSEHDLADRSLGEVLQDQESIHQSLIENSQNDHTRASSSRGIINHGNPENSSQANTIREHLLLNEALARQLQIEEWDSDTSSSEFDVESPSPINESNPSNSLAEVARQDDNDLDNMTYEESIHQSLIENSQNDHTRASSSRGIINHGNPENSSQANTIREHLSLDEALARQLQIEEWDSDTSSSEFDVESPSPINESNPSNSLAEVARQDDNDPDNMTYEERASLVEEVGNESRGLSDEVISYLPIEKYERGFFSRERNNDKCAICLSEYRNGQWRIYLRPCNHVYHADCITPWLKINKICPLCKEEVFGP